MSEKIKLVRDREGPALTVYIDRENDYCTASMHVDQLGIQLSVFFSAAEARQLADMFALAAQQEVAA